MGCLFSLSLMGGGGSNLFIAFLFVKTIETVIRLNTVLIYFLRSSFKDIDFFPKYQGQQFPQGCDLKKNQNLGGRGVGHY